MNGPDPLGRADEDTHAIRNLQKKSALRSIQIDSTNQNDFVVGTDFFVIDRKTTSGLDIPKACNMQLVQVGAL